MAQKKKQYKQQAKKYSAKTTKEKPKSKTPIQENEQLDEIKVKIPTFFSKDIFQTKLKYWTLLLAVLLIVTIGFLAYGDYLTLKLSYYFKDIGSDTINSNFPNINRNPQTADHKGFAGWSFYHGMGQNVFGGYSMNPILYIQAKIHHFTASFYPPEDYRVSKGFPSDFFSRILLSGIFFFLYLRTVSLSYFTSLIGALLYSFTGYMTLGGTWGHTHYLFHAAFLMFSFEQLYKKNRWIFFPFAVMSISGNAYTLYMHGGLFLGIYTLFRYFDENAWKPKGLFILGGKMIFLGLLGMLMNSTHLVSQYMRMFNSPRVGGNASYMATGGKSPIFQLDNFPERLTVLFRTFSNDILGNGSDFKGWYNYLEAPAFYCGLLTLLLLPQIFIFLNKRRKIIYGSFIGFWTLIIFFPKLRHMSQFYVGNYYKASFDVMIPIAMLFIALTVLHLALKESKINKILLSGTLFVLLLALFFPYFPADNTPVDKEIRSSVTLFLIFHSLLLYFIDRKKIKLLLQILIIGLLFIELLYSTSTSMDKRFAYSIEELKKNAGGFKDGTVEAVQYLWTIDNSFYRIEKEYSSGTAQHRSLNDASFQGYYGTSNYASFNQEYYIKFLEGVGIIQIGNETQTRWAQGLKSRPLLQTIGNVKYYFTKQKQSFYEKRGFAQEIAEKDGLKILQNRYYLPLGFSYDTFIKRSDFDKLNQLQKDIAMLRAFVVEDNDENYTKLTDGMKQISLKDTVSNFSFALYAEYVNNLGKESLSLTDHRQSTIDGTVNFSQKKLLFFSIPYDIGWKAMIDGKETEVMLANIGLFGIMVQPGQHTIRLEYWPPYLKESQYTAKISYIVFFLLLIVKNFKYAGKLYNRFLRKNEPTKTEVEV